MKSLLISINCKRKYLWPQEIICLIRSTDALIYRYRRHGGVALGKSFLGKEFHKTLCKKKRGYCFRFKFLWTSFCVIRIWFFIGYWILYRG